MHNSSRVGAATCDYLLHKVGSDAVSHSGSAANQERVSTARSRQGTKI